MRQFFSPVTRRWKKRNRDHRRCSEQPDADADADADVDDDADTGVPTTPRSMVKQAQEFKSIDINSMPTNPSSCSVISESSVSMMEEEESHQDSKRDDRSVDDCKLDAIMALRNVVVKQRERLSDYKSRERQHMQQINRLSNTLQESSPVLGGDQSVSSNTATSANRKRMVFFGPSFERSDDLSGLTSLEDSTTVTEDIQYLVSSIQEQASQVETAMALDELQSIKSEHEALRQLFEKKESEANNLRQELDDRQQQISTLELEKELAQAEATKCKEDLQACLSYIRKNSVEEKEEEPTTICTVKEPKKSDRRHTPRRFFPLRSQRTSQSTSRQRSLQKLNPFADARLSESPDTSTISNRLLCFACRLGEHPNHDDRTLMQTPTKSIPYSTYAVTPSPGGDSTEIDAQEHQSEINIYYKAEADRLLSKVEELEYEQSQTETNRIQQIYQCEQDNRDTKRQYQKQMRLKNIQIAQLRKEVSILCQRQHSERPPVNIGFTSC